MLGCQIPSDPVSTPSARVLIAEDDRVTRNAARVALQLDGHLVAEAGDGPMVLEILATEPPDVLLLDLDLPGIDGIALLAEAAQRARGVPVIIMTACRESGLAGDLMRIGASGLLHKPVNAADLRLAIRTALEPKEIRRYGFHKTKTLDLPLMRMTPVLTAV